MTATQNANVRLITAAAPDAILELAVSQVAGSDGEWCAVSPRAHLARELTARVLDDLDIDAWVGHRVITSAAMLEHFGRALQAQPVLTPLQQRQVIGAIAEQAHAEDPEVLHGRVVGGHIAEATLRALVRLFGEIEPRGKATEDLERELLEGAGSGNLSQRGRDLVLLWQRYKNRLEAEGFLGPRGFELLSAEAAARVPPPEGPTRFLFIGLDGYGPWDPEVRLAYSLANNPRAEEVTIALVAPETTSEGTWSLHGAEPIYVDYTERIGARVIVTSGLERTASDLQAAAKDPFAYRTAPAAATGAVRRFVLPDAGLETEWVARTIKEKILEGRVSPADIAVIDRRMDERAEDFERILSEAGIPSVASFEQRVSQVPAVRAILAAYRVLSDGWRTRDLVAVAESPYLPFELSPTLLNRLGSAGVEPRSAAEWAERIRLLSRGEGTERLGQGVPADVLQEAETLPRRFEDFLQNTENVLGGGQDRTPREWVQSLVVLARDWRLEEAICRPSGMLVDRGERARVVRRDVDGVNALLKGAHDWLRGWEIAGRDPAALISVQHWYAELEAIAREGRIRASSYPRDAVQLLTPSQAALRTWPLVFITGVTDGEFPARVRPDEVTLTEEERRALSLPTTDERDARERLLFHLAVATAERRLIVSAFAADHRGRATVSSAFFDGLSLRIDGLETREIQASELIPTSPEKAALPADRLLLGAGEYRKALGSPEPHLTAAQSSALRVWLNDSRSARTIRAWQAERARWSSMLGTPLEEDEWGLFAGMLSGSDELVVVTPSELEAYGRCPFKYMAGSVWRLDPETDGDEAAAYGRLHHKILERLYEELKAGGFPPQSEEALNQSLRRLDEIAKEEVRAFSSTTQERLYALDLDFVVDVLRSYVRRDLLHAASTAKFDRMGFPRTRIEDLEISVGSRAQPIRAIVHDVEFGLFGRIDRVEAIDDERLGQEFQGALILQDYKSSPNDRLPRPMGYFDGRDLQLPLYAHLAEQVFGRPVFGFQEIRIAQDTDRDPVWRRALLEEGNGISPGPWGFSYYREHHEFDEPIDAAQSVALSKAANAAKSIASGRFDTPPERACWGCRLGTVCRASKYSFNNARERPRPRMPIAVTYEEFSGKGGES